MSSLIIHEKLHNSADSKHSTVSGN